ncbi:Uncharacterised protein [Campylobacter jejuni]|nr:Uncharacterised protein [Campylobacter jejuni]
MSWFYHITSIKPRKQEENHLSNTKCSQTYIKSFNTCNIKEKSS